MMANGDSLVGNVSKVLVMLLYCCTQLAAQNSNSFTIQDALLEVAKAHKLSLVFNADNIPKQQVQFLENSNANLQLDAILQNTNLEYLIESNQIFLFVKRNIYGYIEDAATGERLIAATIYVPETSNYAIANEQGYFSFSTIEDSISIEVSYLGFTTLHKTLGKDLMDRPIVLQLNADNDLEEVLISDLASTAIEQNYIELNKGTDILLHQNQAVSAIGGEPDIFQAMMRQSGVNSGTDGIGGMHVRGGKNDQNLIIVDGVKLYNSAHAFGAFSIINSGIVDQARLFKSGASGSRFGRLSSVMDVKTKDPNLKSIKASGQISTVASQASIELPIIEDKLGIMLTGRRTHIDPFIKNRTSKSKLDDFNSFGETNYSFQDWNLKAYAKLNAKNRIFVSAYRGRDRYDDNDFIDVVDDFGSGYFLDQQLYYDWKNQFASIRYNWLLGAHTIANIQVSAYEYSYENYLEWDVEEEDFGQIFYARDYQEFQSGVKHQNVNLDWQTLIGNHHFQYGATLGKKRYVLGEIIEEERDFEVDPTIPIPEAEYLSIFSIGNYDTQELSIYFSDKFKVSNSWLLDGGLYFTRFSTISELFLDDDYDGQSVHGYLKTLFQLNNYFSIGASVGSYIQVEHLLTTSDNGYPNDIWVPSSEQLKPERSNQLEWFAELTASNQSLKLSTYVKRQENILFYDTIRTLPSLTNIDRDFLEEVLVSGNALGFGVEANYSYFLKDRLALNAAYTYSKTDYQFDRINNGEAFPFDFSIPHTFTIGGNIFLNKRWTFSWDWYYASGKPYTLYNSLFEFSPFDRDIENENIITVDEEDYNSNILPSTHKLSFSFSTYWNWGKARSDLSLGIQNAYNRKNVIYQYELEGVGLQEQLGFALLPMVRWRVGW